MGLLKKKYQIFLEVVNGLISLKRVHSKHIQNEQKTKKEDET